jgi:hypothetical protein
MCEMTLTSSESSESPGITRLRNSRRSSLLRQVSSWERSKALLFDKLKNKKQKDSAYKGVHRLIGSLSGLQAIVDLVLPRSHLHSTNEIGIEDSLLVQTGQE